jgi:GT2 family glycosyltransferase/glycosyltransferase involved in cell wall biosynthesis
MVGVVQESPVVQKVVSILFLGAERPISASPGEIHNWAVASRRRNLPKVTVIIPVYNAAAELKDCLDSLSKTLPSFCEVLVIDDASPDANVQKVLEGYRGKATWRVLKNQGNLGFTRTVNFGILQTDAESDVIILNSDAITHGSWVEALRFVAHREGSIGLVSPLTNDSTPFSILFPSMRKDLKLSRDQLDISRVVRTHGEGRALEVATGHGFCLYIKREVIESVGLLDEKNFPRGYGEENDYCMRARKAGWRTVVAENVYVSHSESKSFTSSEKATLLPIGLEAVNRLHPEYQAINTQLFSLQFSDIRQRIVSGLGSKNVSNPRVLFVVPVKGGGLPMTSEDLSRGLKSWDQLRIVINDAGLFELQERSDSNWMASPGFEKCPTVNPADRKDFRFESWFSNVLHAKGIDVVHVESLQMCSDEIPVLCKNMGVIATFSAHDFYTICPTAHLIDGDGGFCGGRCTEGNADCTSEVGVVFPLPRLRNAYALDWRATMGASLANFAAIIAPSNSAEFRLKKVFKSLPTVHVVAHGRSDITFHEPAGKVAPTIKLVVIGNIGTHKGSKLLASLFPELRKLGIAVDVLGALQGKVPRGLNLVTNYDRSEIPRTLAGGGYSAALFLSIWEETFAHTLTEAWAGGIPSIGLDMGAIGERIMASGNGSAIPMGLSESPKELALEIKRLVTSDEWVRDSAENISAWQLEGAENTVRSMASKYEEIWFSLSRSAAGSVL